MPKEPLFNSNSGHRKRLRDRFLNGGSRALHDYEKLEMLLTYSIPRRDVKNLAKELMNHFGSIQNIMNASPEELAAIKGIGENSAALIILTKELCSTYLAEKMMHKSVISNTREAVDFARMKIGGASRETYMLIFLNSRNQVISYECFQIGTIDRTVIYSRELIECCIHNKAASVILVHNHPSGLCIPSAEDLAVTLRISKALQTVNIRLYDHIIVSASDFHSMAVHKEI